MNGLMYLLQVNLYLLLFYLFYLVLLRNETFFRMNRLYLVGSAILSLAIPLLKANWIKEMFVAEQVYQATQQVSNVVTQVNLYQPAIYAPQPVIKDAPLLTNLKILTLVYGAITLVLLLNFLRKLYLLNKTIESGSKNQAFSFFKKVVVDQDLEGKETIMNHEMVHVKQWHSLDVVFFEIFVAFNWFNPIAFFYRKAIKDIHEFIADETAASTLEEKSAYTLLLVSNVFGTKPQELTNSFFNQSLLKRRIIMLHKTKSRQVAILKYGLSVPLFALMIIISSATIGKSQQVVDVTQELENKISLVLSPKLPEREQDTPKKALKKAKTRGAEKITPLASQNDEEVLKELYDHFLRRTKYPPLEQENNTQGMVYIKFEINEKGIIKSPTTIKAESTGFEGAVMGVLKSERAFDPSLKGRYIVGVRFVLSGPTQSSKEETIDLTNYKGYKQLEEVVIRGYVKLNRSQTEPALDYKNVESSAEFPGGMQGLYEWFKAGFQYPQAAREKGMEGQLIANFIVEKDGSLSNINIVKDAGFDTKEVAVKLLKSSPKWTPATVAGTPVRMTFNLPVNLKVYETRTVGTPGLKEARMSTANTDTVSAYFNTERPVLRMPSKPTYPGGASAFNKYLYENLKFPEEAKKNKATGLVTVSFMVDADGTLSNVKVQNSIGYGCDEEAIRLIKNSGKWNPGKYEDGSPERVGYSLDILFQSGKK